jgi:pimeloyl-ACP methyl ester carboxylesterase
MLHPVARPPDARFPGEWPMPTPADTAPDTSATRKPPAATDTIVLIHGFWVTPRSWEHWIPYYEAKGYRVLAPAYPGLEVEVEELNRDPSPIERLTVPMIIDHLEQIIRGLDRPPILIGHSAGGAFLQLLLDHGFGAAGVTLDSAATEGVLVTPFSQLRSLFPVLDNPTNRHKAVGLSYKEWRYTFTNTFSEEDARSPYERYHVPASGRIVWGSALANFIPGPQDIHVDYHNDSRAPLLFISGAEDQLMPPYVHRSNARHSKSRTVMEVKEFAGRSHLMPAQAGWEEVADYALDWAVRHAATDVRHVMTTMQQPVRGGFLGERRADDQRLTQ